MSLSQVLAAGIVGGGAFEPHMDVVHVIRLVTDETITRAATVRELEQLQRGLIAMHLEKTLKSDRVLRDLRRHG